MGGGCSGRRARGCRQVKSRRVASHGLRGGQGSCEGRCSLAGSLTPGCVGSFVFVTLLACRCGHFHLDNGFLKYIPGQGALPHQKKRNAQPWLRLEGAQTGCVSGRKGGAPPKAEVDTRWVTTSRTLDGRTSVKAVGGERPPRSGNLGWNCRNSAMR